MAENFILLSDNAKSFFALGSNAEAIRLECSINSNDWYKMEEIRPNQFGVYYYDLSCIQAKHKRIAYSNMQLSISEYI